MKGKLLKAIEYILIIFGVSVIIYPFASSFFSQKKQASVIQNYNDTYGSLSSDEAAKQKKLAEEYNNSLSGTVIHDPFIPGSGFQMPSNYENILNIYNGVMGTVEIPKIKVNIPIYHGVSDKVLENGAGHLTETSLPIGGKGTMSVLCAHRGLPTAKLFTDLDKIQVGDKFYINVVNEHHTYVVDSVKVVEPGDTKDMKLVKGKDYVTLLTCTPYGINSHRLLVRGIRTTDDNTAHTNVTNLKYRYFSAEEILIIIIIAAAVIIAITINKLKKRKG